VAGAAVTDSDELALSLALFGSVAVEETVAVLVIVEPAGAAAATWATSVKVAEAPDARLASDAVTVPVPPTAGVDAMKAGPVAWLKLTNVIFGGSTSVSCTFAAGSGPALFTVMV
jgi:hypothetical protein